MSRAVWMEIGIGLIAGLGHLQAAPAAQLPTVTVARAIVRDMPKYVTAVGTVVPLHRVSIVAQVDGQIMDAPFREGQEVHAGDVLYDIDPRVFQAKVEEASAQLARDQAALVDEQLILRRTSTLSRDEFNSQQAVDTALAAVHERQATILVDQAEVTEARINLAFTSVHSPIDGRVGKRLLDPGNVVTASRGQALATVTQVSPIAVEFYVSQSNLGLGINAAALASEVQVVSGPTHDLPLTGRMTLVEDAVDTATGNLTFRATFRNADMLLWPGELVDVRLREKVDRGLLVVPVQAIQQGASGPMVFEVDAANRVRMVPVSLGPELDGLQAVGGDLTPNSEVVVEGADDVMNGMSVRTKKAAQAASLD